MQLPIQNNQAYARLIRPNNSLLLREDQHGTEPEKEPFHTEPTKAIYSKINEGPCQKPW